ncbi:MAG: hypothetical protein Q8K18_11390 [Burkholderiales bacterium]|nr:hypothetical protein [Burkholderiales bacterium]
MIPSALAQQAARPNPSDPAATVPPANYDSPFAGYVPHQDQEVASWRGINDEAARIGGHIGILRQSGMHGSNPPAGPAGPSTTPSPARPAMPAMPGHGAGMK